VIRGYMARRHSAKLSVEGYTSPLTVDKRMPQARIITDAIPPGFFRVQKKPQLRGSFIAVVNYNG